MFDGLPQRHYRVIYADPAWSYSVFSEKGKGRSAERHYQTMTVEQMCALPVKEIAADDAHLFMWVTGPGLVRGDHIPLMHAWGFRPSAMAFVWVKSKVETVRQSGFFLDANLFVKGMGHTTRQNAEYVVLGRRGSPKRLRKDIGQIVVEPRREHSRKPDCVRAKIEAYATGPYVELFARTTAPGWSSWGNQTDKFEAAA